MIFVVRRAQPERARVGVGDLDNEQPIRIGARAVQLADRATGVKRQRAPAVGIGRRRDSGHHARALSFEQWPKAAEVRGDEPDVGAAVAQRPLERTEEARQVVDAVAREQFGEYRDQRAVDAQIGPVIAFAECAHERGRLAGAQGHPQRVGGLKARGGLLGGELLGHGASQPRRVPLRPPASA